MKIYTLTYLNKNYGSILQAFSLQCRLRELGLEPVILQKASKPSRYPRLRIILRLLKPEKNYNLFLRIKRWRDVKRFAQKNAKLARFINERIATRLIKDSDMFLKTLSSEDKFLVGSDQIWSTLNGPLSPWYSLSWVNDSYRKFSYAASFGQGQLNDNQIKCYTEGLKSFQVVSLRETQAFLALKPFFSSRIRQDLDPTLLYKKDFWHKIGSPRMIEEPYIFVYRLRPDKGVIDLAKRIAQQRGCKVIYTGLFAEEFKGVKTVCDAGIEDFISYIEYADVVITNSFHGTAFSITFEKPFLSVAIASTSSRAESLLDIVGLKSQYITDAYSDNYSLEIDFSKAREVLGEEREKSLKYLRSLVER